MGVFVCAGLLVGHPAGHPDSVRRDGIYHLPLQPHARHCGHLTFRPLPDGVPGDLRGKSSGRLSMLAFEGILSPQNHGEVGVFGFMVPQLSPVLTQDL